MMGTKARIFTPVRAISLDELVPADHFYRSLDRVLDLSFVRDLVQDYYAPCGRPSVDPMVFFKLQLVMFFEGVRSERLLMRLVADRLSVRWYLGYNLGEPLPDHSSLTRIRTRYGLEVFRRFFATIVEQCQQAGLAWGRELYVDATHVLADASLESLVPRFAVEARAAIQAHLRVLFSDEPQDEPQAAQEGERTGSASLANPAEPTPLPVVLSDSKREELAEANTTRHDWIAAQGRPQREVRGPNNYYQRVADFRVSTTDPDATPLRLKSGGVHLGYQTHYVVDEGKRRIILGVLVAPARSWRTNRCSISPGTSAFASTCGHTTPPGTPPMAPWRTSRRSNERAFTPTCRCLIGSTRPPTMVPDASAMMPRAMSICALRASRCVRTDAN